MKREKVEVKYAGQRKNTRRQLKADTKTLKKKTGVRAKPNKKKRGFSTQKIELSPISLFLVS